MYSKEYGKGNMEYGIGYVYHGICKKRSGDRSYYSGSTFK